MSKRKNKHLKENKKIVGLKKIILNIILLVFFIIIIISIYNIIKWLKSSKETKDIVAEINDNIEIIEEENIEKYNVDFEELKSKNPDTVAWLKVKGTEVEYPIVKGTNNDYYLTHSFNKKYNVAGWIFADYRNKFDGSDKNIIIYGHNMKDGTMFSTLKDVIKSEWYENEENCKVVFITEQGQFEYQVFSVYQILEKNYDTTIQFDSENQYKNYINSAKSNSVYNFNVDVTTEDEILTLSTCAENNKYRVILQAKKIK